MSICTVTPELDQTMKAGDLYYTSFKVSLIL